MEIKLVPSVSGYLTVQQAAEKMGLGVPQARSYLKRHGVEAVRSGQYSFYKESDIDNAVQELAKRAERHTKSTEDVSPSVATDGNFEELDERTGGLLTQIIQKLVDVNGAVALLGLSSPYGRVVLNKSGLPNVRIGGKTFWLSDQVREYAQGQGGRGTPHMQELQPMLAEDVPHNGRRGRKVAESEPVLA